ncbi:GDP-mannose 4,6-dehydratase [Candidatus Woesearchaeota archaeon]|nr:GDP-mannose 4,6-dehydratase [Candidatus Woesearchaeota archaeon]
METKKALITGIAGFVGSHLAELLLQKKFEVYGTARYRSKLDNISHIQKDLNLVSADITDLKSMVDLMKTVKPDYIFHLAAQSFVPQSWTAPQDTLNNNIIGNCNVLEAVRIAGIDPVMQIAGSSEEYGLVLPNEVPIKETNPLRPLSPYGVSKVAQDLLSQQYFRSYGMKTVITRAFNHTGPRRGEVFVTSNFAKQVAMIEKGAQEPIIYHGNLEAKRDFTDVRDTVKAYLLAVQKGVHGEAYNICSGKNGTYSVQQVVDILLSLSKTEIELKNDPARMRPSDVQILEGSCEKFKKQTGWQPTIKFKKTMQDLLDYWREKA